MDPRSLGTLKRHGSENWKEPIGLWTTHLRSPLVIWAVHFKNWRTRITELGWLVLVQMVWMLLIFHGCHSSVHLNCCCLDHAVAASSGPHSSCVFLVSVVAAASLFTLDAGSTLLCLINSSVLKPLTLIVIFWMGKEKKIKRGKARDRAVLKGEVWTGDRGTAYRKESQWALKGGVINQLALFLNKPHKCSFTASVLFGLGNELASKIGKGLQLN